MRLSHTPRINWNKRREIGSFILHPEDKLE